MKLSFKPLGTLLLIAVAALFVTSTSGESPALVGKPAPEYQFKSLDGSSVDLSSLKGSNVVVLDFWATWCPPCVASLPTMAKIAKEYKSKGVAFYAVNVQETPKEVKAFLKKHKLEDLPVLMDESGDATKKFKVEAFPTSLFIDKAGVVKKGHIGIPSMNMAQVEKIIKADLDELLKAK
ncbi:MAG: TlpA disulfide reductase family protein [Verrucomicrobiota bacterium]|nr:TlpA disulfide reductase family protein [Verrucomicrobiota bacterium]